MIVSALILGVFHPAALQVLCVIGFFSGIVMLVYGLRLRPTSLNSPVSSGSKATNLNHGSLVRPVSTSAIGTVRIIRLSSQLGPLKSVEMTQQQKIATALKNAGATPAAWGQTETCDASDRTPSVQVAPSATVTTTAEKIAHEPAVHETIPNRNRKSILMIWTGSAVALLSLYFFLSISRSF